MTRSGSPHTCQTDGAANVLARQHAIAAFAPVRYFQIRSSGNVCTSERNSHRSTTVISDMQWQGRMHTLPGRV